MIYLHRNKFVEIPSSYLEEWLMAATGNEFLRNYSFHVVSSETKPLANSENKFFYSYVKMQFFS